MKLFRHSIQTKGLKNFFIRFITITRRFGLTGKRYTRYLDKFISLFPVVPITSEIAKAGGFYKRDFGKSYGVGLADAILAATANMEKAHLKTLNVKHYPMITGLKPAYRK